MKRVFISIILTLSFVICITGCTEKESYQINGQYVMETEDENAVFLPRLQFENENQTFIMEHDALSSTVIGGTYEVKGNMIHAESFDGYIYLFDIEDNSTLVFKQDGSAEISLKNEAIGILITDGAIFKKE